MNRLKESSCRVKLIDCCLVTKSSLKRNAFVVSEVVHLEETSKCKIFGQEAAFYGLNWSILSEIMSCKHVWIE